MLKRSKFDILTNILDILYILIFIVVTQVERGVISKVIRFSNLIHS